MEAVAVGVFVLVVIVVLVVVFYGCCQVCCCVKCCGNSGCVGGNGSNGNSGVEGVLVASFKFSFENLFTNSDCQMLIFQHHIFLLMRFRIIIHVLQLFQGITPT